MFDRTGGRSRLISDLSDVSVIGNESRSCGQRRDYTCHNPNPPPFMKNSSSLILLSISLSALRSFALEISSIDYAWPEPPKVGDNTLHILTTSLLELKLINTKAADPARVTQWDFVRNSQFVAPRKNTITVTADGKSISVKGTYFKRRPFYGPVS